MSICKPKYWILLTFILVFPAASLPPIYAGAGSWTILEPMPTARSGLGIAVVDGKIYAIGRQNEEGCLNITEEYNPATNEWTIKTSMPTARSRFAIAVYQNKIYGIGGTNGSGLAGGESILTEANEVYDPATDTWEIKTSMLTSRYKFGVAVINDEQYTIGGKTEINNYTSVNEKYTPAEYIPEFPSWTLPSIVFFAVTLLSIVFMHSFRRGKKL